MKLHYSALALAVYLGTTAAQSMDGLPACARECATDSIPKTCTAIDFANQICRTGGVTNLPQAASCTGGAQSTATETSGASSTTSNASKSTDTASGVSTTTTGASTATGTATGTTTSQSGTGSPTSSASPSATTGAAAVLLGKDTGILAGVGAALFALLA
ncbi:putative CFEM domain protein [Aspergillus terreus]|uniref:Putative CFEM domain protein n=1 Tax=Aspergillus terreus TaxID=33178 RepID=A0A5M3ZBB5_ASPTE|nr:hypothetical protein ATETN484_0011005100 [Aspergillus terreus]GFF18688.1 putative CFEM domain protein [Aspergillus terreus]